MYYEYRIFIQILLSARYQLSIHDITHTDWMLSGAARPNNEHRDCTWTAGRYTATNIVSQSKIDANGRRERMRFASLWKNHPTQQTYR